jgi:hypothetical protein
MASSMRFMVLSSVVTAASPLLVSDREEA